MLKPILALKKNILKVKSSYLTLSDVLTALSICSVTNPLAKNCLDQLVKIKDCDVHSTYILNPAEENTLKKLGLYVTSEPHFINNDLFI